MGGEWTSEELRAAVGAYVQMLRWHQAGEPFVKKDVYRALSEQFPQRTPKAFEYRAQNISHVLGLVGREWVPGLLPARNVGVNVVEKIARILEELGAIDSADHAVFESQVESLLKSSADEIPHGSKRPKRSLGKQAMYERDPHVKAWILGRACGTCEYCGSHAPFVDHRGVPFLEIHHVRPLAENGSDTISNAVALCPNCHRAFHYAEDKEERLEDLYSRVRRLGRE